MGGGFANTVPKFRSAVTFLNHDDDDHADDKSKYLFPLLGLPGRLFSLP